MRSPKDFFKPLAVGAPAPVREIPVRPSRMIHFFPASNPKLRAKVPDMVGTVDVLLATVEHPDGIQVTYNGWPLYFFAGDSAPGDTNGEGQGGVWYAIDPTGNPIDND